MTQIGRADHGPARMGAEHVFHRFTGARPPVAVRGEGIYLIDDNGRRYVDACGGAAVSCLGHGHPEIVAAIGGAGRPVRICPHRVFHERSGRRIGGDGRGNVARDRSIGSGSPSSGSEAIEAALKLARQYHLERGDTQRTHIIARRLSYHGNTLGCAGGGRKRVAARAVCAAADRRRAGRSVLRISLRASRARARRNMARRAADSLEQEIVRLGPETVIGFVAETVVGATAGAVPPVARLPASRFARFAIATACC